MKVKLNQAVKMFFGNSSLEMVYFEAIANSLDAGATKINIDISAKSYSNVESLEITIKDNGGGFSDERYSKFCNLFDVDEGSHKGLGRLVFPFYFEDIQVSSFYNKNFHREFSFTEDIDEESSIVTELQKEMPSGTEIKLQDYTLTRLKQHSFIQPKYIKEKILEKFYPRLYQLKQNKVKFKISISSKVEKSKDTQIVTSLDMPKLKMVELKDSMNLHDKFYLHYAIIKTPQEPSKIISAISVDNRTEKLEIIAEENLPAGYKMIFLLFSDWFIGKVDFIRQNLTIPEYDMQSVHKLFRNQVSEIISIELPFIEKRNKKARKALNNKFPHLTGYFNDSDIGYASFNDIVKNAQDKFFRSQREILGAKILTEEQYNESLELSSRALTEYILFRQLTINKLKNTTKANSEAELHNLFCKQYKRFDKDSAIDDLYQNNAWLLDDKYMSYESVLSDKEMGELIKYITQDENSERNEDKADLALVFSNDPEKSDYFDVVIVELKKKGVSLYDNYKAIHQLEERARHLMQFYKNRIQRIWFYAIIEIDDRTEIALKGEYKELYSSGKMFYREHKVAIQINPDVILPIGIYVWDINAVVADADNRNSTFLNLIKSKFQKK